MRLNSTDVRPYFHKAAKETGTDVRNVSDRAVQQAAVADGHQVSLFTIREARDAMVADAAGAHEQAGALAKDALALQQSSTPTPVASKATGPGTLFSLRLSGGPLTDVADVDVGSKLDRLKASPHVGHITLSGEDLYEDVKAKLESGNYVLRACNPSDLDNVLAGQPLRGAGGGSNIVDHVTQRSGKTSDLISASSKFTHAFSNGSSMHVLIKTPKYYAEHPAPDDLGNYRFVSHDDVMAALRGGDNVTPKDMANAFEAGEVLFRGTLPLDAVVVLDNGLPPAPLHERDGGYASRTAAREAAAAETVDARSDDWRAALADVVGEDQADAYLQKFLATPGASQRTADKNFRGFVKGVRKGRIRL